MRCRGINLPVLLPPTPHHRRLPRSAETATESTGSLGDLPACQRAKWTTNVTAKATAAATVAGDRQTAIVVILQNILNCALFRSACHDDEDATNRLANRSCRAAPRRADRTSPHLTSPHLTSVMKGCSFFGQIDVTETRSDKKCSLTESHSTRFLRNSRKLGFLREMLEVYHHENMVRIFLSQLAGVLQQSCVRRSAQYRRRLCLGRCPLVTIVRQRDSCIVPFMKFSALFSDHRLLRVCFDRSASSA